MILARLRQHARRLAPLVATVALGCASSHEPIAPLPGIASEPLAMVVTHRDLAPGERAQWVRVRADRGTVTVDVVRAAFCDTQVSAAAHRTSGVIDVIASVGGNPLANCAPAPSTFVVAYRITIPQVAAGRVTVRLFERVGDGAASFRGQSSVSIDP
jgi:hypothetical protein